MTETKSTSTTPEATITRDNVRDLRDEAGQAGDLEMVRICDAALGGDGEAWAECAQVIAAARANS